VSVVVVAAVVEEEEEASDARRREADAAMMSSSSTTAATTTTDTPKLKFLANLARPSLGGKDGTEEEEEASDARRREADAAMMAEGDNLPFSCTDACNLARPSLGGKDGTGSGGAGMDLDPLDAADYAPGGVLDPLSDVGPRGEGEVEGRVGVVPPWVR
jgi:hypothetical protein